MSASARANFFCTKLPADPVPHREHSDPRLTWK